MQKPTSALQGISSRKQTDVKVGLWEFQWKVETEKERRLQEQSSKSSPNEQVLPVYRWAVFVTTGKYRGDSRCGPTRTFHLNHGGKRQAAQGPDESTTFLGTILKSRWPAGGMSSPLTGKMSSVTTERNKGGEGSGLFPPVLLTTAGFGCRLCTHLSRGRPVSSEDSDTRTNTSLTALTHQEHGH